MFLLIGDRLKPLRALLRLHRGLSTSSCGFSTWFTKRRGVCWRERERERQRKRERESNIDDVTHLRLIAAIFLRGAPARSTSEIRTWSQPGPRCIAFYSAFYCVCCGWPVVSLSFSLHTSLILFAPPVSSLFSVKEARPAEQGHGRTSSAILSLSFSLSFARCSTPTLHLFYPRTIHSRPLSRCILVKLDFTIRLIWAIAISRESSCSSFHDWIDL